MPGLEVIWNRTNSPSGFSDSDVFRDGLTCVKRYDRLSKDTIHAYHRIHNERSQQPYHIDTYGVFKGEPFAHLIIQVLELGDDIIEVPVISPEGKVVEAKVPFIDGEELACPRDFQRLSLGGRPSYESLKYLQTFACDHMGSFEYMFQGRVVSSMSFLYNSLMLPIRDNIATLVVTDLATSIGDFVAHHERGAS